MTPPLENAQTILQNARSDEVEIIYLADGRIPIEIMPRQQNQAVPPEKGKWARIADELARENALGNGLGDKVRSAIREFREQVEFREPFSAASNTCRYICWTPISSPIWSNKIRFGINRSLSDDIDLLIASTAIETSAVLVSNDHLFSTIGDIYPGFQWENWAL